MYHLFNIQSLVDEHLKWSYFLASVNRATMNMVVQVSLSRLWSPFSLSPGVIPLDHMEVMYLSLDETHYLTSLIPVTLPPTVYKKIHHSPQFCSHM